MNQKLLFAIFLATACLVSFNTNSSWANNPFEPYVPIDGDGPHVCDRPIETTPTGIIPTGTPTTYVPYVPPQQGPIDQYCQYVCQGYESLWEGCVDSWHFWREGERTFRRLIFP